MIRLPGVRLSQSGRRFIRKLLTSNGANKSTRAIFMIIRPSLERVAASLLLGRRNREFKLPTYRVQSYQTIRITYKKMGLNKSKISELSKFLSKKGQIKK